jgi:hypothetical protein
MKARLLVLGLVLPLLAAQDRAGSELKVFSSKEGGFTVLLPGDPKADVKKHKGPGGNKEVANHIFTVDQKTAAYVVAYMIDPGLAKAGEAGIKKALENARRGAEASTRGKPIDKDKPITLDGHPGLEFQLDVPNLGIYRSRVYIVGDRFYQVSILGPKEVATGPQADMVLDSFKLMK